ncbi:MAG: cupredoxin domain-containing protein [Acidimicrobiia bacterium]
MNRRVRWTLLLASFGVLVLPAVPAGAGGGCHREVGSVVTPRPGTEVQLAGNCFSPGVLEVAPGATVRFSNRDDIAHVVLGTGWGSGQEIAPGLSVEHRFERAGTYAYSCYLHPSMNGAVVVAGGAPAATAGPAAAAELASSTSSAGVDRGSLALGAVAGTLVAVATGRWRRRQTVGGIAG